VVKDSWQDSKKESLHQHKHSFTPALPAVEEAEDAAGPSDRCAARAAACTCRALELASMRRVALHVLLLSPASSPPCYLLALGYVNWCACCAAFPIMLHI
jgi:hypothetical protein